MQLTIDPTQFDIFVGIDVDRKSYAATYLDHQFQGRSLKMPSDSKALLQYFRKHFPDKRLVFAYEAGPTGFELHDYLTSLGYVCLVIHPASLKSAPNECAKTNRIDSRKIVEQLKAGQLKGIHVPYGPYRTLRHLTQLREQYARLSTRSKQRIKAFLLFEHIDVPDNTGQQVYTAKFRPILKSLPLDPGLRFKLDMLLDDLDHVRQRLLSVLKELRAFCEKEPAIQQNLKYLQSIPGIGFIVSSFVLARIGDPAHLSNIRELAAFCGIVPREHSTGDTVSRGSITHMGNRTFRQLLVEAAWVAIRKDSELGNFYWRIRTRIQKSYGVRVAIVAVARKLSQRVYRVLKDQREYFVH